jgi:radical SAM protein (TIGR01212 family)
MEVAPVIGVPEMVEGAQRYRKVNGFLRETFGEKVYRVGLRGGFTCPNRDGAKGEGGCLFCNPASSEPLGYEPGMAMSRQLAEGVEYIRERHEADRFIAFLSDYTATYGEVGRLEELYRGALDHPDVVGLALGTRPDCLPPEVLDLLEKIARETFLWVELGIQSANEDSLAMLQRRHSVDDSRNAIAALRERGIAVSAHVILGLPGESREEMLATARFLGENRVHAAKIHNLHIVKNTPLATIYREGGCRLLDLDEYAELAVSFLEHLPSSIVIQRVSGEAPRRLTVAPSWSVNKLAVLNAVQRELERRDTWQGRALGCTLEELQQPASLRY